MTTILTTLHNLLLHITIILTTPNNQLLHHTSISCVLQKNKNTKNKQKKRDNHGFLLIKQLHYDYFIKSSLIK